MIHLRSVSLKARVKKRNEFPFSVPVIRNLKKIEFVSPVTFFVGENGSGKSTLLEAIASALKMITVGGEDIERDETLLNVRQLSAALQFVWEKRRTHRGFFLRA